MVPATAGAAVGTVVPITGGPGGAISGILDAFAPLAAGLPDRDLLFVDVRGVGRSGRLSCPSLEGPELLVGERLVEANARCAEHLGRRRDHYRTVASVLDVEAVRRALDLPAPSLLSFSYGTFLATTYAVLFPDVVQGAVLDGADPLDKNPWDVAVPRGVARVARLECERGMGCDGDALVEDIATVADALRRRPHPVPGLTQPLTEGLFATLAQAFVQAGDRTFVAAVEAAAAGDLRPLEPLAALVATNDVEGARRDGQSTALGTTIWCNDDTFVHRTDVEPSVRRRQFDDALALLADDVFAPFSRSGWIDSSWDHPDECLGWPPSRVPPALRVPRLGPFPDLPVLLLNGDLDLQTPIESARTAAAQFPNHRLIEVVNGPHAIIPASPCLLVASLEFLRSAVLPDATRCAEDPIADPAAGPVAQYTVGTKRCSSTGGRT